MDVLGKKVENQVQFWSLLGPFFVLLSITVLLFKVSPHWYVPVSALLGIPLCVKWKMKGMVAALCCLFLLAGMSYQQLELDDRYWHVGLSLAMAFSFIVLTLSLEEVQGLVEKLQLESQSRLDNFLLLDEKWKAAEFEWSLQNEKAKSEAIALTQELAKIQEDKQTFYKLAQLAKEELVQVKGQHNQLLQDLLYKKQQIAQLHERLEETEMTIQTFVNSDSEKQIQVLTEGLANLEREKEGLKTKLVLEQEERDAYQIEKEHLWRELQACQEREKLCLIDQHRCQIDRQDQQNILQTLHNKCTILEQEKQNLLQVQAKMQQQYEEGRHLEEQQKLILQQSQKKIEDLEIKFLEAEKQKHSLQLFRKQLEEEKSRLEAQLQKKEEQQKTTFQQLQEELKECKKSEAQLKENQQQIVQKNLQEKNALVQEIRDLRERYQQTQENFVQSIRELEDKKERFSQMQDKIENLNSELNAQQALLKQYAEQKQILENLKGELEQVLQQTQEQLQQTKQKLEISQQHWEKLPYSPGNTRQIESMYIQLKEQFEEKSQILDATRRELFHVNEKLLKYQKEYEEEHVFDQSTNEKYLQRYIVQLGKESEQMQKFYQQEIDNLAQLVGYLLR